MPVAHQVIFERGSDDDDVVGSLVEKFSDRAERVVQQGIFFADADGDQRFRPEIADFEDEWDLAGEGDPPAGEADEKLRR